MVARNFPARAAFPKWQEGRHPHCHFRGQLRLHAYYGPLDRSAAQGDLCHEAPALSVTRPSRLSTLRVESSSTGGVRTAPLAKHADTYSCPCVRYSHCKCCLSAYLGNKGSLPSGGIPMSRTFILASV